MPPTKRQLASQKKKAKIIQTTLDLLLKKGNAVSTSTTAVCAAARVTRPTLYHFFGSKRNLLLSVHLESIETILKPYLEKAAAIEDPLTRLTFMVRTFTTEIICLHPELRILIHDSLTMKDKYFREIREAWKKHYLLLRDTIVELQKAKKINAEIKSSWATLFVLGMLTWTTYWFDFERKTDIELIADQAEHLVLHGLGLKEA
ncbi:MAG: TetR/AcrR family transcriptional regulator [Deltaproteobacteria bacterium]|nr:TetR/AcrR family transcriptional regulator [Deltaproteobacteria bacterium]